MALSTRVRYRVSHDTTYHYAATVSSGRHFTHLRPRNTSHQQVLSHELSFSPAPAEHLERDDYYGNHSCSILLNTPHDTLTVSSLSEVEVLPNPPPDATFAQPWELALPPALHAWEEEGVTEMRLPSPHVECLEEAGAYARDCFTPGRPWLEAMLELTQRIHDEFVYDPKATTISTPVSEVIRNRHGVCQDFAHLMLSCLRTLKLPARYVSGYLLNEPPPGVDKLTGSDASHAWIESWLPGSGWVGFDPTNGKRSNEEFITVAWGRDFMDVTPLRGVVLGGGSHTLEVSVTVSRIADGA